MNREKKLRPRTSVHLPRSFSPGFEPSPPALEAINSAPNASLAPREANLQSHQTGFPVRVGSNLGGKLQKLVFRTILSLPKINVLGRVRGSNAYFAT